MTSAEPPQPATDASPASSAAAGPAPRRPALQIPASPSRARDRPPLSLSRTARTTPQAAEPAATDEQTAARPTPESDPTPRETRRRPVPSGPAAPKYARLARRDMLITSTQSAGLASLTAEVMNDPHRQQVASSERERITDATLVRVAIDLLLTRHRDELSGVTEDELRASVGLPPLQY